VAVGSSWRSSQTYGDAEIRQRGGDLLDGPIGWRPEDEAADAFPTARKTFFDEAAGDADFAQGVEKAPRGARSDGESAAGAPGAMRCESQSASIVVATTFISAAFDFPGSSNAARRDRFT
jgi:hypothetical protein